MLRSLPKFKYCGLTIIMSNHSRFDITRLLSGNGGVMFGNFCLQPELNSMMCDVRLKDDMSPFLPNTKCLLLLGEPTMHHYLPETLKNSLHEMRGSLFYVNGIPAICSYLPQQAVDIFKDVEKQSNPLSDGYTPDDEVFTGSDEGEDEDEGDVKRHGRTKRTNYAFWLRRDTWKCKQILFSTSVWQRECERPKPIYKIFPHPKEVIEILRDTKDKDLLIDTETDYEECNLQCFSFSLDYRTVYSVPVLDYNYRIAFPEVPQVLQALAIGISRNTTVAHNGACFDFLVFALKYHIPLGPSSYDTLIALHRCFPDLEKSLGHATSYWTWEKFHKDEDSQGYRTNDQMVNRMKYCGKDVYTMGLIKQAVTEYAKTIPGLESSINDAMACIRPYLISTLNGIKVNRKLTDDKVKENDALMFQYNRLIEYFVGEKALGEIRGKKKLGMFAGSNPQCVKYFHEMLGYPVIARGKPSIVDGKRAPSLGKKALYRLALKHDNPVINLICAYREVKKETTRLRFLPWVSTEDMMRDSCQWTIGGTKSFRLGSRALFKKKRLLPNGEWKERGLGGNLANIEKSMREIYIADEVPNE